MPNSLIILYILLPILFATLYSSDYSLSSSFNFRDVESPKVLLLTAHPDDEAFFFGPTLTTLVLSRENKLPHFNEPELFSLCLSVGDADGLGAVRTTELDKSLDILGFKPENRWVVDHMYVAYRFEVT
jgi:N-acetylglucosaminylphosphatidylinositol deacetylase